MSVYPQCTSVLPCVSQPHTLCRERTRKSILPLLHPYAHSTHTYSSLTFSLLSLSVPSPQNCTHIWPEKGADELRLFTGIDLNVPCPGAGGNRPEKVWVNI